MRLAVIDHVGNHGGGSRVVRALLPAIKAHRPTLEIDYFGNPGSIRRELIREEFEPLGIKVQELQTLLIASAASAGSLLSKAARFIQSRVGHRVPFLPLILSGAVHSEIERVVRGYDLAYFPWPFMVRCPDLSCPIVGTFHDFNFRYFFGAHIFTPEQLDLLNRETPIWLARATPVVSTNFMAQELGKFYPDHARKVRVVHLAPPVARDVHSEADAIRIVADLGISGPFAIYPTHLTVHKNIGPLLVAFALLRDRGHQATLVLTGNGTERVKGKACSLGVELGAQDPDVIGLGYVSNAQMDALLRMASVVVSSSLYEAGNGPGLEGWASGIPVAMSNIPPFTEHIAVQGVHAEVFDPRNPVDIADKIQSILIAPASATDKALRSQAALANLTWDKVAQEYLAVFDDAIMDRPKGHPVEVS